MTFGERIKKIRELFGITSNEFAELVGIHPVTIRKYETNKMNPSKEHIDKMCEALKLPRMIFEGIPVSYTDYSHVGDFYQTWLTLLSNQTIRLGYVDEKVISKNDYEHFVINDKLSSYITISYEGKEIPLNRLQIQFNEQSEDSCYKFFDYFSMWAKTKDALNQIKSGEWDEKKQNMTLEEATSFYQKEGEILELELMLAWHNWTQYMEGEGTDEEEAKSRLQKILDNGGSYYDYVDGLDAPESYKEELIEIYEYEMIMDLTGMKDHDKGATNPQELMKRYHEMDAVANKYLTEHASEFRTKKF